MQKFLINKYPWTIQFINSKDKLMYNEETDVQRLGLTFYMPLKIYIVNDMSNELIKNAIIHELIHAYIFSYGIRELADEECVCEFFGAHMESIMVLADYLYKALKSENGNGRSTQANGQVNSED